MSRLLVVDTNVIRAAGISEKPISKASREVLFAIRDICHRVTYTESLRQEWKKHSSLLSRLWMGSMAAKKKPVKIGSEIKIALPQDELSEKDYDAISKDLHILQTALAADKIIITLETKLQEALAKTQKTKRILNSIKWINPLNDGAKRLKNL